MTFAEIPQRFLDEREYAETMGWGPVREEPLVSVVVTTYQQAEFIEDCLEGVLMQKTAFSFEIIVGEDGSTDGTRERCVTYATRHPNQIRLFLRSRREAVYSTRGRQRRVNGIWSRQAARGAFIAVCDGDDLWTDPLKLQKQVDFLRARPDCVSCFHAVDLDDRIHRVLRRASIAPAARADGRYGLDDLLRLGNLIHTSSEVYRNTPVLDPPEWFYALPYRDFARHALLLGTGDDRWIGYMPECMAVYRMHSVGSWFSRGRQQRIADELEVYMALGENLDIEHRPEWKRAFSRLLASHTLARLSRRAVIEDLVMIWRKSPRLATTFALWVLPTRILDLVMKRASHLLPGSRTS